MAHGAMTNVNEISAAAPAAKVKNAPTTGHLR